MGHIQAGRQGTYPNVTVKVFNVSNFLGVGYIDENFEVL